MTPNRIHSLCAVLLLIVLSACVRAPAEQSPAPANAEDERAEAARAVDGLAKAYQATADAMEAGPVTLRHVESACFWSERLMAAQGHVADLRVAGLPAGWDRNREIAPAGLPAGGSLPAAALSGFQIATYRPRR